MPHLYKLFRTFLDDWQQVIISGTFTVLEALVFVGFCKRQEHFLIMVNEAMDDINGPTEKILRGPPANVFFKLGQCQPLRGVMSLLV